MDDLTVNQDIAIQNSTLSIQGKILDKYRIVSQLGSGNNGVVFLAEHTLLQRMIALKVWLKISPRDTRDKVEQGLAEVRKMTQSHPNYVAQMYDADIVNNAIFYATMEYVDGTTLKDLLRAMPDDGKRLVYAYLYLQAIRETTTPEIAHGDPHHGNVMIFTEKMTNGNDALRLKLIDFGTSIILGKATWEERHWRTVDRTFRKILSPFSILKEMMVQYQPNKCRTIRDRVARYDEVLGEVVTRRIDLKPRTADIFGLREGFVPPSTPDIEEEMKKYAELLKAKKN